MIQKEEPPGYLYFIIKGEDIETPEDTTIFVKIGMTKDPCSRISNYITHHLGETPPIYYKIWQVRNEKFEESRALEFFEEQRVIKTGTTCRSEVIRTTKRDIDAYSPQDPQKRAIAPHTMLPAEHYVIKYDIAQRFEEHWEELREIQNRTISEIVSFLRIQKSNTASQKASLARKIRAPCGTGKTHMTCEAIRIVATEDASLKVCVLCPTKIIAEQWRGNFYRLGIQAPILTKTDIRTKEGEIKEDQTGHRFYIVVYASCPALKADPTWTYVFDEAHHTCGATDGDNGITKRLVNETSSAGCRRLFLTFTPKNYIRDDVNSMDNLELYGSDIEFPNMQDLVKAGLMPDYRLILTYRNHEETLKATSEEIKNVKKIIVCLQSVEAIEETQKYLTEQLNENGVYAVNGNMSNEQVAENINNFVDYSGRSWLLSCLVLLEGADIPVADTVVLLASWKTETRLIQLLLRPGRWYPKKPTFNIISPTDDSHLIETNLRVAGFEVLPNKIQHLRAIVPATKSSSSSALGHVWCVSYTEKNTIEGGLTPATSDFDSAIAKSQIAAMQLGLDKATPGDMVILRGPLHVAFASVLAVKVVFETIDSAQNENETKTKKRTILDVNFLPIHSTGGSILLSVKQYRECINELWEGRSDKDWICNPRFTGGFRYDKDRHTLISHLTNNKKEEKIEESVISEKISSVSQVEPSNQQKKRSSDGKVLFIEGVRKNWLASNIMTKDLLRAELTDDGWTCPREITVDILKELEEKLAEISTINRSKAKDNRRKRIETIIKERDYILSRLGTKETI